MILGMAEKSPFFACETSDKKPQKMQIEPKIFTIFVAITSIITLKQ